jgi:hypothetical protein
LAQACLFVVIGCPDGHDGCSCACTNGRFHRGVARRCHGFDMRILAYDIKVVTAGEGVGIVTYDVVLRVPATEDQS